MIRLVASGWRNGQDVSYEVWKMVTIQDSTSHLLRGTYEGTGLLRVTENVGWYDGEAA
ncbi:MAG: hypothetical protein LIP11_06385 [Clostridiales bacterium]|nr:hypothetical protein [Clostridiales bacterium]